MKKNIFKLLTLTALSTFMFSCSSDLLDEVPVDGDIVTVGESPVTSEDKMEKALNGMFATFATGDAFGADILIFGDLISPNIFVSQTNSNYFVTTNAMSWTASGSDFNQYNELYDAVSSANDIINSTIEETANVKVLKAQAHIGRALSYFYLLQFYSANPTSGLHQDLGIPIYTGNYDPNGKYGRSTVAESFDQIISDLEAGIVSGNEIPVNKGYFSNTVAKFLLAKVYLYRGGAGDNQKALDLANEVLTSSPSVYASISNEDYINYFTTDDGQNSSETIWEVNMSGLNNPQVNAAMATFYTYSPTGGGHFSLLVRQDLFDKIEASDLRKELFHTDNVAANDSPLGVGIKKYPRSGSNGYLYNIKVFRMTEVNFIKWEAMIKLGQSAAALAELNAFATSRGATIPYTGDVLSALITEKQKEFVGEGHTFFDFKRNNLGITKSSNCFSNCSVDANSKFFTMPIPRQSVNLNPLMVQYPDWID